MEKSQKMKWSMLAMLLWVITFYILTPSVYSSPQISDINGHWSQAIIQKMVDADIVSGNPDGTFKPDKNISRAEFSVMLVKAYKLQEQTGKVFNDTANHWAKDYIATATANDIVTGYGNNTFGPDDPITREQMAVMMVKAVKYQAITSGLTFVDDSQISSWAKDAVETAYANKIISGYNNYFRPLDKATKAEAAVIINAGMAVVTAPPTADEFDKAGTYGPVTGTQTIEDDVVISVADVVLQNTIITGNLILAEGIGNGDVTLNNITVKGKTYARGGGANSIHINGGQYHSIVVEKTPSGSIRIIATDANGLAVVVAENAAGEQIILEGNFDSVDIQASNVVISTQGATSIGGINVGSNLSGITINLASGTTVNTVQLDSVTDINGKGTITNPATGSKATESTFETQPGTPPVVVIGSGGSGGGPNVESSATPEAIVKSAISAFAPTTATIDIKGKMDFMGGNNFSAKGTASIAADKKCTSTLAVDLGIGGINSPAPAFCPFSEIIAGPEAAGLALAKTAKLSEEGNNYVLTVTGAACPESLLGILDGASIGSKAVVKFKLTVDYTIKVDKTSQKVVAVDIKGSGTGKVMGQDRATTITGTITYKAVTYSVLTVPTVPPSPNANTPVSINSVVSVDINNLATFQQQETLTVSLPSNVSIPENQITVEVPEYVSGNKQSLLQQMVSINQSSPRNVEITITGQNMSGPGQFFIRFGNLIVLSENKDLQASFIASANSAFPNSLITIARIMRGSISGKVLDNQGKPIAYGHVSASSINGNPSGNQANTDVNGNYSIKSLASGKYRVKAQANGWINQDYSSNVSVTAPNDTANINFSLQRGGSISGRVLDDQGNPIAHASVSASVYGSTSSYSAGTDGNGNYSIQGLANGEYRVIAQADGCINQYYSSNVIVTAPDDRTNINFNLQRGGSISGRILDEQGNPIANADVSARLVDGSSYSQYASTDANGNYSINKLANGEYGVKVQADGWINQDYSSNVSVTASNDTANINFSLQRGGSISGRVLDDQGNPIANASVSASVYGSSSGYSVGTDTNGNYSIQSLASGEYRVSVDANGWIRQDYPNNVSVQAPNDTANIDFTFQQRGGRISGRVLDEQGNPRVSIQVCADLINGGKGWGTITDANGYYIFDRLVSGEYRVYLQIGELIRQEYAGNVSVTAPAETANINFTLKQDT